MTAIGFYAPMKPPTHPTPSGDRQMARALIKALSHGPDQPRTPRVDLMSELRIYDGQGDAAHQAALIASARDEAARLIKRGRAQGADIWVTYHNYYKAPDLLGPTVSRALGIPYVLIEATRARKRLTGPWAAFSALSEHACDAADVVFHFTEQDRKALTEYAPKGQKLIKLHPFLPLNSLPPTADLTTNNLLSVGMMRFGAKLASYQIIADTLAKLQTTDWQLKIIGDGPARSDIEAMFTSFGARVSFAGLLDPVATQAAYQDAALFLWPGVDEAFGMVYLEAQAAGLPIIAQHRPGVCDVVSPASLTPISGGSDGLAEAADALLADLKIRQAVGENVRKFVAKNHLLGAASQALWSQLAPLIEQKGRPLS